MKHLKHILLIAVAIIAIGNLTAKNDETTLSSLNDRVIHATNLNDSVAALYDLFDASPREKKVEVGSELLEIAKNHDLQEVLVDIIPQLSIIRLRDREAQTRYLIDADFIHDPQQRTAVKLFVEVVIATNESNYLPIEDRKRVLLKYAKADMIESGDFYQNLLDLYRVVIFMGKFTESNLYLEYLTRLENMVKELPGQSYYLRNMFYTTAANVHTAKGNYAKALQSDSILLDVIKDLEDKYEGMGRNYRDYDRYKYICYRRMLSNYPALSLSQTKELYEKCEELAKKNPEVASDMKKSWKPLISLLMKEGRYAEAIPKIKASLEFENGQKASSNRTKLNLLGMLVQAADSVNDKATLLESTSLFNNLLLKALENQSMESYNELQVRYEVNDLRNQNTQLEIEKRDAELATSQKVVSIILGGLLVLAVMMMLLYRSHFSLRQKARELRAENERLHQYVETMFNDGKPSGTSELKHRHDIGDHNWNH